MSPLAVVEQFNILEQLVAGLSSGTPATLIDQFDFESGEKTFCHRVVPAIAFTAHAASDAVCRQHFAAGRTSFEQPDMDSVLALGFAATTAVYLGRAEVARERLDQMRRAANQNSQWEIAWAEMWTALFYALMREYERVEPFAQRALDLSEQFQLTALIINSRALLGHARAQLGRAGDGIALIRRGLADTSKSHVLSLARIFMYLAAAQLQAGVIEDAFESIEQSLLVNPDLLIVRPEALSLRGELRARKGQAVSAKADFRESIALARNMGAKMLELRSSVSLARLFASEGLGDEARAMLAEIYSWFTQGFDSVDLKEAKALLEKLGAGAPNRSQSPKN